MYLSTVSLTDLLSRGWNIFVNVDQENGERRDIKRDMLSVLVARMKGVKGKCRFPFDE